MLQLEAAEQEMLASMMPDGDRVAQFKSAQT